MLCQPNAPGHALCLWQHLPSRLAPSGLAGSRTPWAIILAKCSRVRSWSFSASPGLNWGNHCVEGTQEKPHWWIVSVFLPKWLNITCFARANPDKCQIMTLDPNRVGLESKHSWPLPQNIQYWLWKSYLPSFNFLGYFFSLGNGQEKAQNHHSNQWLAAFNFFSMFLGWERIQGGDHYWMFLDIYIRPCLKCTSWFHKQKLVRSVETSLSRKLEGLGCYPVFPMLPCKQSSLALVSAVVTLLHLSFLVLLTGAVTFVRIFRKGTPRWLSWFGFPPCSSS